MRRSLRGRLLGAVFLAILGFSPRAASAIEAVAFLSTGSPGEVWGGGLGAALTSTWFKIVMVDAELARQNYNAADGQLLSFSAAACLAPSFGRFVPYAGFGVGVHRQTLGPLSDNGTLTSLMVGGRLKLGLLVLRAEYRTFELSGNPRVPLEHRISVGAGISF